MKRIDRIFLAAGAGALGLLVAGADTASAAQLTVSSLVPQSGYLGSDAPSIPLTATPYDFTGQGYGNLTSVDSITVMLTLNNGSTGAGEVDENNLTLGLDGIDTGLKLNGFLANQIVTLTFTDNPGTASAILAALQADGQLVGSIIDAVPGNNPFVGAPGVIDTALSITGTISNGGGPNVIPVPAAALLAPLGASMAAGVARRMRRERKAV